jgi:hypothetical protein
MRDRRNRRIRSARLYGGSQLINQLRHTKVPRRENGAFFFALSMLMHGLYPTPPSVITSRQNTVYLKQHSLCT